MFLIVNEIVSAIALSGMFLLGDKLSGFVPTNEFSKGVNFSKKYLAIIKIN